MCWCLCKYVLLKHIQWKLERHGLIGGNFFKGWQCKLNCLKVNDKHRVAYFVEEGDNLFAIYRHTPLWDRFHITKLRCREFDVALFVLVERITYGSNALSPPHHFPRYRTRRKRKNVIVCHFDWIMHFLRQTHSLYKKRTHLPTWAVGADVLRKARYNRDARQQSIQLSQTLITCQVTTTTTTSTSTTVQIIIVALFLLLFFTTFFIIIVIIIIIIITSFCLISFATRGQSLLRVSFFDFIFVLFALDFF